MGSSLIPFLEAYFAHWLKTSEAGRRSVALLGFDSARDALFETLNAGLSNWKAIARASLESPRVFLVNRLWPGLFAEAAHDRCSRYSSRSVGESPQGIAAFLGGSRGR